MPLELESPAETSPNSFVSNGPLMQARQACWRPGVTESEMLVNRGRSRRVEVFFATLFLGATSGITIWLLVAMVLPLFLRDYSWMYSYLLGFLGVVALGMSCYIFTIGWGALRWTRKYRETKDIDWYAKYLDDMGGPRREEMREWNSVQHFVIVTNYKESLEMMRLMAYALMSQRAHLSKRQLNLVLAMEEREGDAAREKAAMLSREFRSFFRDILVTYHPENLPGECRGKASNYKWAVKMVDEYVRDGAGNAAGISEEDCVIHVADADSLYDPNYFANVTYLWCSRHDRHELVWQPCMISTCNFWELAAPCRAINLMIAAQEMMSAHARFEFQVPFSTYGFSLKTLHRIGGTGSAADAQDGDVIAEDHHLFIKGYFALDGMLRVQPIFLPCLCFAVGGEPDSLWVNLKNRYTQAKRHMFGISEMFYTFSLACRRPCCCRSRPMQCSRCIRTVMMCSKLLKIHFVPYAGLWIPLGMILVTLLKVHKFLCQRWEHPIHRVCDYALFGATESVGAWIFSFSTSLTFAGGIFVVVSFSRMLYATHHTLTHIGDPNGDFMGSFVLQPEHSPAASPPAAQQPLRESPWSRRHRRPVVVGGGFPWLGTVVQLAVEFFAMGLITSFFFGSVPAILGLLRFIYHGHTMEYITAPKPGNADGTARRAVSPTPPAWEHLPPGVGRGGGERRSGPLGGS